ncbi:MAG: c-type cytochrome [Rhizobacter sp.]|nr:c-type cytochrome [Rhizobacter sp.]
MSNCPDLLKALVLGLALSAAAAQAQTAYPGIGRPATDKEVRAWDIDVRPDFKGLPKGSGTVAKGQDVWEARCASCHGVFGESNEVFSPLVGGTTADDVKTGRVARLLDPSFPGRTTLMKASTVSTLWDYINRAMPWNAPKSLSTDEVYAVLAYLLNMGGVLPDDYTLSDQTMADAQSRLPNRNGMRLDHAMWPGKGLATGKGPDVKAVACMTDCAAEPKVRSFLPDHARNAHGNLAEQRRPWASEIGADHQAAGRDAASVKPAAKAAGGGDSAAALALMNQHSCNACHGVDAKIVGPAFRDVAKKYAGRADGAAYLAGKIKSGGSGVWGAIPMPPQTLPDADVQTLARWLADGAKK